jgi:hypothetical protein
MKKFFKLDESAIIVDNKVAVLWAFANSGFRF